ncbi:MAG: WGR domain-containing protein [Myxococcales bacterium]|nr:WGR domain-containing protein [Myxococcales bacterium]
MRRFEFVEGTSAKFWMASVEGVNFIVVYGRLGTPGQRKEKAFPTEDGARKEYEKKVAEKLREGYHEVAADAAESAPSGAKGAAAASAKLELPQRGRAPTTDAAKIARAAGALVGFARSAGRRSWVVRRAADNARRALRAVGTIDPASVASIAAPLEELVGLAIAPKGQKRVPLESVCALLAELDVAAFDRAVDRWKAAGASAPGAKVIEALSKQRESLEDPELALRVGVLLSARPGRAGTVSKHGVAKRFAKHVKPHLESYLVSKGGRVRGHLDAIETKGDPALASVVSALKSA